MTRERTSAMPLREHASGRTRMRCNAVIPTVMAETLKPITAPINRRLQAFVAEVNRMFGHEGVAVPRTPELVIAEAVTHVHSARPVQTTDGR
jgi:hypothetical protein